jgi:predicted HTH domain antitoxin
MKVTLNIPDDLVSALPGDDSCRGKSVLLELACGLYAARRLTHAQASKLAGLDRLDFDRERGFREIPIHYSEEDWREDFEAGMCDQ